MGSVQAASINARARPKSADAEPSLLLEQEVGPASRSAVDQASPMGVVEARPPPGHPTAAACAGLSRWPASSRSRRLPAGEVLEHEIRAVVVLAPVEDLRDVGVG